MLLAIVIGSGMMGERLATGNIALALLGNTLSTGAVAFPSGAHRMSDFPITIYHNPACGTSRNTLAMLRTAGYKPTVVEYLQTGWTRSQLENLLAAMNARPREILREKAAPAEELGLVNSGATDSQILDAMVAHPVLVNRPIVVTPRGVRLARPSETVFDLLDRKLGSFVKEDGEVLRPGRGDAM